MIPSEPVKAAITRMNTIFAVVIFLLVLSCTSFAGSIEESKKVLDMIENHAERICQKIPLEGEGNSLDLTGEGKAELNGLITKLANLGIKGAIKYGSKEYKGLLQEDIAEVLNKSTDCKLVIWNRLIDRLLSSDETQSRMPTPPLSRSPESYSLQEPFQYQCIVDNTTLLIDGDGNVLPGGYARPSSHPRCLFDLIAPDKTSYCVNKEDGEVLLTDEQGWYSVGRCRACESIDDCR